jgi:hypothetical protein
MTSGERPINMREPKLNSKLRSFEYITRQNWPHDNRGITQSMMQITVGVRDFDRKKAAQAKQREFYGTVTGEISSKLKMIAIFSLKTVIK